MSCASKHKPEQHWLHFGLHYSSYSPPVGSLVGFRASTGSVEAVVQPNGLIIVTISGFFVISKDRFVYLKVFKNSHEFVGL